MIHGLTVSRSKRTRTLVSTPSPGILRKLSFLIALLITSVLPAELTHCQDARPVNEEQNQGERKLAGKVIDTKRSVDARTLPTLKVESSKPWRLLLED